MIFPSAPHEVLDYWELLADRDAFERAWLDYLEEHDLDAVLFPSNALVALPSLGAGGALARECCRYCALRRFRLCEW